MKGGILIWRKGILTEQKNDWWRSAIIYQIYPRSFLDTNNDGIGDLVGISNKLHYIKSLGVDAIWISPFFKSPMKDYGYDVSDYRAIDPLFGTMQDFDTLLERAHALGLKIIIDLVLSHTSNEHPWFSDSSKKDWYVWADAKEDGSAPNNWVSLFGGQAWEWDDHHQQYYLHNFLKEQPDLNFHNKEVQEETLDICRFWLDKGVDGFRLDVVNFYFHDSLLRDNPPREASAGYATQFEHDTPYSAQQHIYDKSRPENLDFIADLRALTDRYKNRVLIGEIGDDHPYTLAQLYTRGKSHLHTTYNPHMMSGTYKELSEDLVRKPIQDFYDIKKSDESANSMNTDKGWPSWAFSNHDVVRAASRWYKPFDHDPRLSKLLIATLGCLPGTLFLYQGEELGLPEAQIPYESLHDPWAKETWPDWQGRDGCRTPMVWNGSKPYLGFSQKRPWLPIPKTHEVQHVQHQENDRNSVLNFTKKFIHWRKSKINIFNEDVEFINTNHCKVLHIKWKNNIYETNCIFNLSDKILIYNKKELGPFDFHIDGFSDEN